MSHTVRYRVPEVHETETTVGDEPTKKGSIHHREMTEFVGLVTRSHDDGTHDIVIFPPDKPPVHVHKVAEGHGPGTFSLPQAASEPPAKKH